MSEPSEASGASNANKAEQSFPGAFCEPCNKWRKLDHLMPDGSCPRCGSQLDDSLPLASSASDADGAQMPEPQVEPYKVPWHFWVMVAATILYLGWRLVQGIQALF